MAAEFFLDTGVFVASFDKSAPARAERARRLIAQGLAGQGCVSWQVVQEFTNVAMRGFEHSFDHDALREYLDVALFQLCKLYPDKELYLEAVGVQQETRSAWLDSLILASAIRLGCATLYSESLPHDRVVRGCRIVDPFL